jgi:hypothetical protein
MWQNCADRESTPIVFAESEVLMNATAANEFQSMNSVLKVFAFSKRPEARDVVGIPIDPDNGCHDVFL